MPCAKARRNFRQLADNITDAFWIRSSDMREVHYISPAFERIWGRFCGKPVMPTRNCGPTLLCQRTVNAYWASSPPSRETRRVWTLSIASRGPTARSVGFVSGVIKSGMPRIN